MLCGSSRMWNDQNPPLARLRWPALAYQQGLFAKVDGQTEVAATGDRELM